MDCDPGLPYPSLMQPEPPAQLFADGPTLKLRSGSLSFPKVPITIPNVDLPDLEVFGGR